MRQLALIVCVCLLSVSVFSEIHRVALDGSGDFTQIQSAINAARPGDAVHVRPGIYIENIEFLGHDILLISDDPYNRSTVEQTVIKAATHQPVVTFSGTETPACRLEGLTIRDGFTTQFGGGIRGNASRPTIRRCIIQNNTALSTGGGLWGCNGLIDSCTLIGNTAQAGAAAAGCQGLIQNCVIAENAAAGGGLAFNNCDGIITLCTIVSNTGGAEGVFLNCDGIIENCILWDNSAVGFVNSSSPSHCCFPNANGANGNIHLAPRFVFPGSYRLRIDSPCVDAGTATPSSALPEIDYFGRLRRLDGKGVGQARVDMGAAEFDSSESLMMVSRESVALKAIDGQPIHTSENLYIANAGSGEFHWKINETPPAWLTASPRSGTCAAGREPNTLSITADAQGLAPGQYTCSLVLEAPRAVNAPVTVLVEFTVVQLEEIRVPEVYPTIQDALDAAVDGSRIVVADGVYTGPFNMNLDFCGKQVVLESENGPEHCIIDCQGQGRGFYFHSGEDETAVVKGFTIRNGYVTDSLPGQDDPGTGYIIGGGGMLIKNSSPSVRNCRLIQNGSPVQGMDGGGLLLYNSASQITGCTLSKNTADYGGAIRIYNVPRQAAGPVIKNCTLSGNTARGGGAIYSYDQGVAITQISFCTIVGNRGVVYASGAGLYGDYFQVKNSILWANGNGTEHAQLYPGSHAINYSCVQGWTGSLGGIGNISEVPKFVRPGYWVPENSQWQDPSVPPTTYDPVVPAWVEGDYRLQSEGWRWDSEAQRWTFDEATSPCIDTGNPADDPADELPCLPFDPEGFYGLSRRVNMGAYGQTAQASLAPAQQVLLTDLTNDGITDLDDLLLVTEKWLRTGYDPFLKAKGTDFTRDNHVNLADLACLGWEWMQKKLTREPLAHWTLDQNWLDTTGNLAGAQAGGALISHSFYKIGLGAAYFDGIDDKVIMQDFKGVGGDRDRTVCLWFNSTDVNKVLVGWGSVEPQGKWLIMIGEDGKASLRIQGGNVTSAPTVNDGRWHHLAVVLNTDGAAADTADVTLYIDGWQVPSEVLAGTIDTDDIYSLSLGWFEGNNSYYQGFIDDLRVYDTALSLRQIREIVGATLPEPHGAS